MSYLEQALYGWINNMLSGGLRILLKKRFVTYTFLVIVLSIIVTALSFIKNDAPLVYTLLFDLEVATCASLVITGLLSLKVWAMKRELLIFLSLTSLFFLVSAFFPDVYLLAFEDLVIYASFYVWVITVNLVTLISIRAIIVSWPGWVLKLGDPQNRILFSPIIKIGVILSFFWFIYLLYTGQVFFLGLFGILTAWAVIYSILVVTKLHKEANLASMLSIFYLYSLYHVVVSTAKMTGFLAVDAILVVFTTIVTAQGISNLIAGKKHLVPYHWDSLIILVLGFALGYHVLIVKIGFEGLGFLLGVYHDLSFGFCSLIIFGALILFMLHKPFRQFSKGEITTKSIFNTIIDLGALSINNAVKNVKKSIKKGFKFELKKKEK